MFASVDTLEITIPNAVAAIWGNGVHVCRTGTFFGAVGGAAHMRAYLPAVLDSAHQCFGVRSSMSILLDSRARHGIKPVGGTSIEMPTRVTGRCGALEWLREDIDGR
jgi:hypothetical protein